MSDAAESILEKRYYLRDEHGDVKETWEQLANRVVRGVLGVEHPDYEEMTELIRDRKFLPNSPTLMNAGTGMGTMSACFVLGLEDTMEGIMKSASDQAMVQKFGGGTGFALSSLRPKGDAIATTHGAACGPVAVLRHLSSVSKLVTQGGKRDGANMAVLRVDHPDILEFIDCKSVEGDIHNFNISVGITDDFMRAVIVDSYYNLVNPRNGVVTDSLRARDVWSKIINGAYTNGEPGVVFLDQANREHRRLGLPEIEATNPCGEQPLLANESCNLGSIAVNHYVTEHGDFDWDGLRTAVRLAVKFLDAVIDKNVYATKDLEYATKYTRKIGLGVMGWADALIELGVSYGSEESYHIADKLFSFIREEADCGSRELAGGSRWDGRHNACTTTIAPTGTISMIAGVSSGIEPLFALGYRKQNILEGQGFDFVNEAFESEARNGGFYSEELMEHVANGGSIQDRADVPDWAKALFKVSADIDPKAHVRMQAAFQKHCDSGVSKTINLPNEATQEDVADAYMLAWQLGCKGLTVYRQGSREKEVLTTKPSQDYTGSTWVATQVIPAGGDGRNHEDNLTHEEGCTTRATREEGCLKCYGCGVSAC